MKRLPAIVLQGLLLFAVAALAGAQPPDSTPGSPIPPLKAPVQKNVRPATNNPRGAVGANRLNNFTPPTYTNTQDNANNGSYKAEQLRIWNSPEMLQARMNVMDHARRSVRVGQREGQQFLNRLSQLSPTDMQNWLDRYKLQQERLTQALDAQENARQMRVANALDQIQTTQQAFDNINAGQSEASDTLREQQLSQQQLAVQLLEAIREGRNSPVYGPMFTYDPFAPTFDPASPNAYTRRAAAASLPGDLARGDSLNFIRGDVNPDTGIATGIRGIGTAVIGPPGLGGGGSATGNQGAVGGGGAGAAAAAAGGGAAAGGAGGAGGGGGGP